MKLEDIRKLIDEATPGPWRKNGTRIYCNEPDFTTGALKTVAHVSNLSNLELIAASRTLMPKLVHALTVCKIFFDGDGCTCDQGGECLPCLERRRAAIRALDAMEAEC